MSNGELRIYIRNSKFAIRNPLPLSLFDPIL